MASACGVAGACGVASPYGVAGACGVASACCVAGGCDVAGAGGAKIIKTLREKVGAKVVMNSTKCTASSAKSTKLSQSQSNCN